MNTQERAMIQLILNVQAQILENQIDSINGVITHKQYSKSSKLKVDCLEAIDKLIEPAKPIENLIKKGEINHPSYIILRDEINEIFNYWNRCDLIKHNKIKGSNALAIKQALNNINKTKILIAIDNFDEACNSEKYLWKKQSLTIFLNNHLLTFLDSSKPLERYKRR